MDRERAQNWVVKIRKDPGKHFVINEIKVCSEHLKPEDYLCGGENPHAPRCLLKSTAVPSLFPWSSISTERTTTTSQRAGLELECELSSSDEESSVSTTES